MTSKRKSPRPPASVPAPHPGEDPLLRSEERFRLLVEQVQDYAIFMLDTRGCVTSWNAGAERIKGYRAPEILGQHFSRFYPKEAVARGWPSEELQLALRAGRFENEGWRVRRDGSTFWANVVITPLYDAEGLHRGFAKITRDMTDRKRLEDLEMGERRTQEFLAMLAHELRNPLAPIRNAVFLLDSGDAQTRLNARGVIERQLGHLTRLVEDLLDVSRVTSGRIALRRVPLNLSSVVLRAVESSLPLIQARHQSFDLDVPSDLIWVDGDVDRLAQVVLNLLNNAAKFTPEGGRIQLSVRAERAEAVIQVRDTGIGIAQDLLPHVFDLFRQGDRSLARSEGGLGIGLTLVRRLVELHGGTIEARSKGQERGSEFTVRLPLAGPPKDVGETLGAEPTAASPPDRRRILVVDDNADATESIAVLLQLWGHEVRTALDGPTAISIAAEFGPEIVLLDIGLPGMHGYEVARQLRTMKALERATLMAVTGYGREEDRRRALDGGFDRYLIKPLDPELLRRLIDSWTSKPANPHE